MNEEIDTEFFASLASVWQRIGKRRARSEMELTSDELLQSVSFMYELTGEQEKLLSDLQSDAFNYFIHEVNPNNCLVVDSTKAGWPSSIAAVGMALSAYPVGVERD